MRTTIERVTCDICGKDSTPKTYTVTINKEFACAVGESSGTRYCDVCHFCFLALMQTINKLDTRVENIP